MNTILLIENHEMMRLFLLNLLGADYDVHAVATIQEATSWLKGGHADLILGGYTDAQLASEVNRLREYAAAKSTPWIVLTEQDKSEQRIKALSWGAKDCVSKPFNPVELKLRIQSHLSYFTFSRGLVSVA
jgi:DNA-binding response OmpR family regulator